MLVIMPLMEAFGKGDPVTNDAWNQLDAEAEAVQLILTWIDIDIYSTVNACPNACEMWKAIERFYEMMNELVKNKCDVRNHQVNVQFLLQLQLEWKRFVTLVKQSQELKTVSYHKLYDILKQNQNEVNEIRSVKDSMLTANPLAPWASTTNQNRGKAIVNSPPPTYDQEPEMVAENDALSKEKEIDKLMALISLSFKKIYKPTNNNLRTSSNTSRANQDNTPRINKGTGCDNQRAINVARTRENVGIRSTLFIHGTIQDVTPDAIDNSRPIFDAEPLQKVQNDDDNYNVFANDIEHPRQPKSVNVTYPNEHGDTNITTDSLDMSNNRVEADQDEDVDDNDHDLAREHDLLAFLIEKLKCKIDERKDHNKLLESSNKNLVDKLKIEIEDFKNKNKCLESSNNYFKEANTKLAKTNQLMFKDLKKLQVELERYHDVSYVSKVEIDYAKAKGDLINKKELIAHQETISIMSQEKEDQKKFHKNHEDKELEKVIALENKIKVLDDIVYKTGKSVQTMNMLNHNCKTSFVKPKFLKKAQRENPRLYDIGCYNDNLALMLAFESEETIRLVQESRSKLSDLIKPFDYKNLNNLYDLFVPQRDKSPEQRHFSKREYYYDDHMNATLGVYTRLDEVTNLQCDYLKALEKCQSLENEISKRNTKSKSFEALQRHAINLELALQQFNAQILPQNTNSILKNTNVISLGMYKVHTEPNQSRTPQLPQDIRKTNKRVSFSIGVIPTTSVSRPQLKNNQMGDRVLPNNSQGKMQEVEDHRRNFKFSNNKTSVTACNDSLNAKTSNVNFVCVTCGKCVLNNNHDLCVLHYINDVNSRTSQPMAVPISTREPKYNVNQFVATSHKKTVATDSTVKKPRYTTRKIYEQVSKICSWWYPKFTPPRYNWKPKSTIGNVNLNASMPLGNETRNANILEHMTPRGLHAQVRTVRTDKGMEFLNKTLHAYFAKEGIRHETSTAQTPEQNDVVKRQNCTLVEAARTMLNVAKVPLFFWAEAVATTCFTQNCSVVIPRHKKIPYHIINAQKPSVKFFHIFGSPCYIIKDGENLDKMQEKGDACIFVGYSTQSRAYMVFNKRTRIIVETIHVNFDELPQMASDHASSDPVLQCLTTVLEQESLSPDPQSQENVPQIAETI
ncbi:retrovirus-related pol polyprotein from transposon TNT 1-94 [Tanacetum coccineum]